MKINAGKYVGWYVIFGQFNTILFVRRIWRGNGGIQLDLLDNVTVGLHNELHEEVYKLP